MKTKILFFKDETGEWIPFSLAVENLDKWTLFCQKLSLLRSDKLHPDYSDYLNFMEQIKK